MTRKTISTQASAEKALLAAVDVKDKKDAWTAEDSINELAQLAVTAGAEVVGKVVQKLPKPSTTSYIGKGKLDELSALKESLNYDVLIADDELTPLQQRTLEDTLKVKIIDRAALILDIFAKRAHTREGRLQVELAQHQYLLPRLAGQWSHLERLGAGIGTRGPGESQLETDKRLIRQRISRLEKQIEEVRRHRELYREHRRKAGVPVATLVGYTNAGKSTLLNALSNAGVLVEDRLFSTLDPTTRRLLLPDGSPVLITDTVGFINKLPPTLIKAFRATLEELAESDILINVVDFTSHNAPEQCQTVEDILAGLGVQDKPRITALNKIDLLLASEQAWNEESALDYFSEKMEPMGEKTVFISAAKGWGLKNMLEMVGPLLKAAKQTSRINVTL